MHGPIDQPNNWSELVDPWLMLAVHSKSSSLETSHWNSTSRDTVGYHSHGLTRHVPADPDKENAQWMLDWHLSPHVIDLYSTYRPIDAVPSSATRPQIWHSVELSYNSKSISIPVILGRQLQAAGETQSWLVWAATSGCSVDSCQVGNE